MKKKRLKKAKAIRYLILGWKAIDVARDLGISQMTLAIWMANPEFRAEWERLEDAIIEAMDARIKNVRSRAIDVLEKMLDSTNANDRRFAVAQALTLGKKHTGLTTSVVKHEHSGNISQQHSGEIEVSKIPKDARKNLMSFLEATRSMSSDS